MKMRDNLMKSKKKNYKEAKSLLNEAFTLVAIMKDFQIIFFKNPMTKFAIKVLVNQKKKKYLMYFRKGKNEI